MVVLVSVITGVVVKESQTKVPEPFLDFCVTDEEYLAVKEVSE